MPKGSIQLDGVWKRFAADQRDTLLTYELSRVLKGIGSHADRYRWALRDLDIHIEPGEAVALVGHNGSGKTTLLKIMTRVMHPYAGRVEVAGRIGALIEVTAGIHPDLSGRENIVLYGSLLGVPRKRMAELLDEIVDFAEIGDALERLVKFYSWGMKMRLGFAVAAFLEPDVLLVDEVLAVGDSRFQQKCLTQMRHVLDNGTTVILVSHDMAAIEALCSRGILLDHGDMKVDGPLREVLGAYRADIERASLTEILEGEAVRIFACSVTGPDGGPPMSDRPLSVELLMQADKNLVGDVYLGVSEGPSMPIILVRGSVSLKEGKAEVRCELGNLPLPDGDYALWFGVLDDDGRDVIPWRAAASFKVHGPPMVAPPVGIMRLAPVHVQAEWSVEAS